MHVVAVESECVLPDCVPARVDLQPSSNVWYDILKDKIRHQQAKPVWVSEVTVSHTPPLLTHAY